MKNVVKYLVLAAGAFCIGMSVNNFAMSDVPVNYKVAVVDVAKVVSESSQVKALKADREKKVKELAAFVTKARADVAKEKDAKKRQALEDKYNKEFLSKRAAIQKDYANKLKQIDKNIGNVIEQKAKAENYNIVLAKGIVLYGGSDITSEVAKAVK